MEKKKIMLYVGAMFAIALVSSVATAFVLSEFAIMQVWTLGDDHFWLEHGNHGGREVIQLRTDFDNVANPWEIEWKEGDGVTNDGTLTINGRGVCLDNGYSTLGKECFTQDFMTLRANA